MECVLLELGLDQDQFDLYNGIDDPDFGGTPDAVADLDALLYDPVELARYDVLFVNCSHDDFEDVLTDPDVRDNLEGYVARGGRLYVTDWSYDYVEQVSQFSDRIDFAPGPSDGAPEPRDDAAVGPEGVTIDAHVEDADLASWLEAVEDVAGGELISERRTVQISHLASDWVMQYGADEGLGKVWLRGDAGGGLEGSRPLTTTFDYQSCGRVLYSSYHTTGREEPDWDEGPNYVFPSYCTGSGLTPQERVLLYLILHVADCIQVVE
jgi:hypothetical protein